jgi:catechol 2,3-dioxygenase-like lactoylglutathione lyase family enzyme
MASEHAAVYPLPPRAKRSNRRSCAFIDSWPPPLLAHGCEVDYVDPGKWMAEDPQWGSRYGATRHDHPEESLVIDHVYISVTDIGRSLAFYSAALAPLGWRELGSYDSSSGPAGVPDLYGVGDGAYGSGTRVGASIWLRLRQPGETGLYVGFAADDHASVDAAYAAAIDAGGTSEGKPAVRSYFGSGYYAANVGDFDGNHLEIVNKSFNPRSRQSQ